MSSVRDGDDESSRRWWPPAYLPPLTFRISSLGAAHDQLVLEDLREAHPGLFASSAERVWGVSWRLDTALTPQVMSDVHGEQLTRESEDGNGG